MKNFWIAENTVEDLDINALALSGYVLVYPNAEMTTEAFESHLALDLE